MKKLYAERSLFRARLFSTAPKTTPATMRPRLRGEYGELATASGPMVRKLKRAVGITTHTFAADGRVSAFYHPTRSTDEKDGNPIEVALPNRSERRRQAAYTRRALWRSINQECGPDDGRTRPLSR